MINQYNLLQNKMSTMIFKQKEIKMELLNLNDKQKKNFEKNILKPFKNFVSESKSFLNGIEDNSEEIRVLLSKKFDPLFCLAVYLDDEKNEWKLECGKNKLYFPNEQNTIIEYANRVSEKQCTQIAKFDSHLQRDFSSITGLQIDVRFRGDLTKYKVLICLNLSSKELPFI